MGRSFSFSEKPVLFLIQSIPSLLPGIGKVVSIFYSQETQNLQSFSISSDKLELKANELQLEDSASILKKLRHENAPFTWLGKADIPFEVILKDKKQLTIFNELQNNVLLLRLYNEYDHLRDLFFVYFNDNLSNFGINGNEKTLSTDNKTIIAHILRNTLNTFLDTLKADRELFIDLRYYTQSLVDENNILREDLAQTKKKYEEGFIQLCHKYLSDISQKNGKSYLLTEGAITKIKDMQGDYFNLRIILEKAADFADSLSIDNSVQEVMIYDFHIIVMDKPVKKVIESSPPSISEIPAKYSKTAILLDKLETAASIVKSKNMLLTSSNLCGEYPTSMTPPAITDALKKHRPKILYLFSAFPSQWVIIRNEFRPIQNILAAKKDVNKASA